MDILRQLLTTKYTRLLVELLRSVGTPGLLKLFVMSAICLLPPAIIMLADRRRAAVAVDNDVRRIAKAIRNDEYVDVVTLSKHTTVKYTDDGNIIVEQESTWE